MEVWEDSETKGNFNIRYKEQIEAHQLGSVIFSAWPCSPASSLVRRTLWQTITKRAFGDGIL